MSNSKKKKLFIQLFAQPSSFLLLFRGPLPRWKSAILPQHHPHGHPQGVSARARASEIGPRLGKVSGEPAERSQRQRQRQSQREREERAERTGETRCFRARGTQALEPNVLERSLVFGTPVERLLEKTPGGGGGSLRSRRGREVRCPMILVVLPVVLQSTHVPEQLVLMTENTYTHILAQLTKNAL